LDLEKDEFDVPHVVGHPPWLCDLVCSVEVEDGVEAPLVAIEEYRPVLVELPTGLGQFIQKSAWVPQKRLQKGFEDLAAAVYRYDAPLPI